MMKFYKDKDGQVFAYEADGSQDHLIKDKIKMTEKEVEAHINPIKSEEQIREEYNFPILNEIQKLKIDLNIPIMRLAVGTDSEKIEAQNQLEVLNSEIRALEAKLI